MQIPGVPPRPVHSDFLEAGTGCSILASLPVGGDSTRGEEPPVAIFPLGDRLLLRHLTLGPICLAVPYPPGSGSVTTTW